MRSGFFASLVAIGAAVIVALFVGRLAHLAK